MTLRRMRDSLKQPISLKWKWAVFLFVAMSLVSSAGLFLYHIQTVSQESDQANQEMTQNFEDMKHYLEEYTAPFNAMDMQLTITPEGIQRFNQQQDLFRYFRFIDQDKYQVRLLSNEGQVAYESTEIKLPISGKTSKPKLISFNGESFMVIHQDLKSVQTGQPIGSLELIGGPQVFQNYKDFQSRTFLIILFLEIIISVIAAILLSMQFLRPLTYLNNSLDRVEEDSLADIRVRKPNSNDEWSDLSVHINRLLDRIDKYVGNQKRFVEDVSHELRTPVAVVEGHLKLLNRWGKDDPEVLAESIATSLQEITRMKTLVQEMLDLSRADHVDVDYKDEVTEVYSTTQQVFNNMELIHPDFDFYLDSDQHEGEKEYVRMFRNHFEQILIILMDNAVKYSTDRQEIHLSLSRSATHVEIAVQDFGEGMSKDDKDRIFERFYRVDKARSRAKGGTGLGLSIAYQLIKSYRGDIRVDSVLGNGSIFYIQLPLLDSDSDLIYKKPKAPDSPSV